MGAETVAQGKWPWKVSNCFQYPATSGRIRAAAKLFKKNKTTTGVIRIARQILFTPDDLALLITVSIAVKIREEAFADN